MEDALSHDELLRNLTAQARLLWGDQRAEALQAQLEGTARQLVEIGRNPPGAYTEPGLYPPLHS